MEVSMKMCKGCGSPFMPQADEDFCWRCRNSKSSKEEEVLDYLRENPGVSILDVSRTTQLSTKTLLNMAREGRFAGLNLNKDFGYPCGSCGKLITFGTYCPECFALMKRDVKNVKNFNYAKQRPTISRSASMSDEDMVNMFYGKKVKEERGRSRTFSDGMQDEIGSRNKKR